MASPLKKSGFNQGIYQQSATCLERVGRMRYLDDGRVFMYCKAGGSALAAGKVNYAENLDATWVNEAGVATAGVAIGEKNFSLTITAAGAAIAENQFAGGFLHINDATGEGHQYLIAGNSAVAQSGTSISITLEEGIRVALTSSSEFTLVSSLGWEVVETTTQGVPVGVAPIAVTANYYFWNQRRGIANVLIHGTPAIGVLVDQSHEVAGSLKAYATLTNIPVGRMVETGVDTEYKPVELIL